MDPKQKLINKKQELEHIIKSRQENFMTPLHELTGDLSTYDQHPADSATELYEREKDLAVMELYELELEKAHDAEAEARRSQVGTGDRSEKIRTYNFPQGRVTDHRIGLTLHKLDTIVNGNLDELLDALVTAKQSERLQQVK